MCSENKENWNLVDLMGYAEVENMQKVRSGDCK